MLVEEPRAYSVHFHLATLLQDYEEDYISALYHYKQYLALRPDTEKTALVQDRIRVTEQLLAPQLLRKLGDSVQGLSQAHLLKENDTLKRQITKLEGEKSVLSEAKDRAEKNATAAQVETDRLREILNKIRSAEKAEKDANTASVIAERERAANNTKTRDAKSLRELRKEAEEDASEAAKQTATKPADESASEVLKKVQQKLDEAPVPTVANTTDVKTEVHTTAKEKKGKPVTEPRTYTVQSGDTLFKVSEKFYNDATHWKKIRDANRANIDPDGRIRVGQVIIVP
jgi:nucleoid-associated protein YgaU